MLELLQKKWDEILEYLKTEYNISQVSFNTWLKQLKVSDVSDDVITLSVDSSHIGSNISFIEKKYGLFIKTAIAEITNLDFELKFVSHTNAAQTIKHPAAPIVNKGLVSQSLSLNPRYTFDNFVVSSNNQLAHAAALTVAESPAEFYNPLYIYGDVGLGKTHLMHSIAQYIIEHNPSFKVMYVQSEKFTNELIEAIRHGANTPPDFREKYRSVDVLLIDDIQFIIGKERTQEEFFHTFNTLYESKKQIVISSDKPPKDLATLEERLRSRFEWGLTVDLTFPDFETKMAILQKKVEIGNYKIDNDILKYIATNINSNIRELEGSLTKVIAMSRLQKRDINMQLAEEALKDIIYPNKKKIITPDLIIDVVSEHFSLNKEDLSSSRRNRSFSIPRQIAMYLCKQLTSVSCTDLGNIFNKDHSTILHGSAKIENDIKNDAMLKNTVDIIIKKINPD